ncbi:LysM peptidoglycan-binding domain-containing protein [Blastococcus sp. SYSU D00820]
MAASVRQQVPLVPVEVPVPAAPGRPPLRLLPPPPVVRAVPARPAGREVDAGAARPAARPGGRPVRLAGAPRPVRGGCAAPAGPAPLRLTRRGRRLVAALGIVAGVGAAVLVSEVVGGGAGAGLELAGGESVVVQPGDTVWSIATEVSGGEADVRAVVDAIEELNDLEGAVLVPGQVLQLP